MTENPVVKEELNDIGVKDIINFIKKRFSRTFVIAAYSFIAVVLLIALVWLFTPGKTSIIKTINIMLPLKTGRIVYPSGKVYNTSDLISPVVLKTVYDKNNLKGRIEYDKFVSLFYFPKTNFKKELIAAGYKGKLQKKNLTVIELKQLEEDYSQELARSFGSQTEIAMEPHYKLTNAEIIKILNEIPRTWFQTYAILEARTYPIIETNTHMKDLSKSIGKTGQFILLDKTRAFCRQLQNTCRELNAIANGQNVFLPSGESLQDLIIKLGFIASYQIRVFQQIVVDQNEYYDPLDRIFIRSHLQHIDRSLDELKAKYEGTLAAVDILNQKELKNNAGSTGNGQGSPLTLQLGHDFLSTLTSLISSSQSLKLRELYAEKALEYKNSMAHYEAEKKYYLSILNPQNKVRYDNVKTIDREEFYKREQEMFQELFKLNDKVRQFRDLILEKHLLTRSFFLENGETYEQKSYILPVKKVALGLILLWIVFNFVMVSIDFYNQFTNGKLRD